MAKFGFRQLGAFLFCLGAAAGNIGCGEDTTVGMAPLVVNLDAGVATDQEVLSDAEPNAGGVQATFKLLDPVTGRGVSGVSLRYSDQMVETNAQGEGTLSLPSGAFEVRMEKPGVRVHTIFGVAGDDDFTQVSYFSSEMITGFVLRSLGLTEDPEKGILVVGP